MVNISKELDKYGITPERYRADVKMLLDVGFTEVEARKIILCESAANNARIAIQHYDELMGEPYCLERSQITKMMRGCGAQRKICVFMQHFLCLIQKGYGRDLIIDLVSRHGGALVLEAVAVNHDHLVGQGLGHDHIVRLGKLSGGGEIIDLFATLYPALADNGVTIIKMIGYAEKLRNLGKIRRFLKLAETQLYSTLSLDELFQQVNAERCPLTSGKRKYRDFSPGLSFFTGKSVEEPLEVRHAVNDGQTAWEKVENAFVSNLCELLF